MNLKRLLKTADMANAAPAAADLPPTFEGLGTPGVGARFVCVANAQESGPMDAEGWMRLTVYGRHPYGENPHKEPTDIQEFDASSASALVRRFKAAANALTRLVFRTDPARPVYYGHPDHPHFSAQGHDDFTLRAQITDMEARPDGLYIRPVFTDQGNALLQSGQKLYWSPRWLTELVRTEGNLRIWRPFKLVSAGIVPVPNIYGSAANAASTQSSSSIDMPELLQKLLAKLKLTGDLANAAAAPESLDAAAVAQIDTALDTLLDAANSYTDLLPPIMRALGYTDAEIAAASEDTTAAPSVEELTTRLKATLATAETSETAAATASQAADQANARVAAITAELNAERRARATLVVERAIADGRVSPADTDTEVAALATASDFANASTALLTRAKILPAGGKAAALGTRKGEVQDMANARQAFDTALQDFANAASIDLATESGWQRAHRDFKATEKGKALLAALNQPPEA